jgi:Domain of unknown function (DUF6468)
MTIVSLLADGLVASLLVATIASSYTLSQRLTRLKADESVMRTTVRELLQATESAERAIVGLRSALDECDDTLADKLHVAERTSTHLHESVGAGEQIVARIAQIVETTRRILNTTEIKREQSLMSTAPLKTAPLANDDTPPQENAQEISQESVAPMTTAERLEKSAVLARRLSERAMRRYETGQAA